MRKLRRKSIIESCHLKGGRRGFNSWDYEVIAEEVFLCRKSFRVESCTGAGQAVAAVGTMRKLRRIFFVES